MHSSIVLSCDWDTFRLAMVCKFFGGLTHMSRLERVRNGGSLEVKSQADMYGGIIVCNAIFQLTISCCLPGTFTIKLHSCPKLRWKLMSLGHHF